MTEDLDLPKRGILVIIRHGQSVHNEKNILAGWIDSELSPKGIAEARHCAGLLKESGIDFDICFCSWLRRSIRTLWTILDCNDIMHTPVISSWKLNECHCGEYTGLKFMSLKADPSAEAFHKWRVTYDVPPPMLTKDDPRSPLVDKKYKNVNPDDLPLGESLEMAWKRAEDFWKKEIMSRVYEGKNVLVVTHGNLIRAMKRFCEGISIQEMMGKGVVANGRILVYEYEGSKLMASNLLGGGSKSEAF
jgi:2,3-bisphosphoglycerate-dependent phosphoglycerate mutase